MIVEKGHFNFAEKYWGGGGKGRGRTKGPPGPHCSYDLEMRQAVSRSQMLFKIGVLKKFTNFTGKHLCWSRFLIKLQGWKRSFITIVFWNFGTDPATQTFFLCFHRLTKTTALTPAVMTKPLFAQNSLGLSLAMLIAFTHLDLFPWLHVKRFQITEV